MIYLFIIIKRGYTCFLITTHKFLSRFTIINHHFTQKYLLKVTNDLFINKPNYLLKVSILHPSSSACDNVDHLSWLYFFFCLNYLTFLWLSSPVFLLNRLVTLPHGILTLLINNIGIFKPFFLNIVFYYFFFSPFLVANFRR